MPFSTRIAAIVALSLSSAPAIASDEFTPALEQYLETNIAAWANDAMIVDALRGANAVTSGYDSAQINALDQAWRAEVGTANTPTISPVLDHPASAFLRDQVAASGGTVTEVFIMDSVGLNVAASGVTSDMWQGDEAKFTATYGAGADGVHIGSVELDESTQTYQGQISLTIIDPDTGAPIGAITVGVDAESLL